MFPPLSKIQKVSKNNNYIFRNFIKKIVCLIFLINASVALAQIPGKMDAIYSGTPWFDQYGKVVSAHGACLIKESNYKKVE